MSLLRRASASPEEQEQRRQKAAQKSERLRRVAQARSATKMMTSPEPQRGLYLAAFLAATALYSFLSTDQEAVSNTVKGKTHVSYQAVTHPAEAVILFVFVLIAAGTIYWRRRLVTGIAFMLTAAIGLGTPFPKAASDLQYVVFLGPAAYVLWMLVFRMNKEQKDVLAKLGPVSSAPSTPRNASRRSSRSSSTTTSRRGSQPPATSTGRPLPPSSGRYTPPRAKPKAGQRKSQGAKARPAP